VFGTGASYNYSYGYTYGPSRESTPAHHHEDGTVESLREKRMGS
jgi:hypothetical protein